MGAGMPFAMQAMSTSIPKVTSSSPDSGTGCTVGGSVTNIAFISSCRKDRISMEEALSMDGRIRERGEEFRPKKKRLSSRLIESLREHIETRRGYRPQEAVRQEGQPRVIWIETRKCLSLLFISLGCFPSICNFLSTIRLIDLKEARLPGAISSATWKSLYL